MRRRRRPAHREPHALPGTAYRGLPPVQLADPGQTGAAGESAARAHHLRGIVDQLGATRRRGRRLPLTARGRHLLQADTPTLWAAITAALIPADPAEAAAAEIMLMQLLTGPPPRYDDSPMIADALNGGGWTTDDGPLTRDYTGWLTGPLFGRLGLPGSAGQTHPRRPLPTHPSRQRRRTQGAATPRPRTPAAPLTTSPWDPLTGAPAGADHQADCNRRSPPRPSVGGRRIVAAVEHQHDIRCPCQAAALPTSRAERSMDQRPRRLRSPPVSNTELDWGRATPRRLTPNRRSLAA